MSATALDDLAHLRESSADDRAKRDLQNSRVKWRPEDFTETTELTEMLKAEWEVGFRSCGLLACVFLFLDDWLDDEPGMQLTHRFVCVLVVVWRQQTANVGSAELTSALFAQSFADKKAVDSVSVPLCHQDTTAVWQG